MQVTIHPSSARGSIQAPPSKSYSHRALIAAALAPGASRIRGVSLSRDLRATMDCLRALGAAVDFSGGEAVVTGIDPWQLPVGARLPCEDSGSTLRFLIPIALLSDKPVCFTGSDILMSRPLSVYQNICTGQGLAFHPSPRALSVCGPLQPGEFLVPGDISSQFISGLLFALPLLRRDSLIRIEPPAESRPYIGMTVSTLAQFGVDVDYAGHTIRIPGGQVYAAGDMEIEGDWSGAAFFLALNRLNGQVEVDGLCRDSLQGDRVCTDLFDALGSGTPTIDLTHCPDLGPICMALAAALHGATFTGIRRLRFKESDRCASMAEELAKFGVHVRVHENTMTVSPGSLRRPDGPVRSHGDHRVVMALAVLATVTGAVIDGAEAVDKSMPHFFERLQDLGIEVTSP